jgi:hypothetical protein
LLTWFGLAWDGSSALCYRLISGLIQSKTYTTRPNLTELLRDVLVRVELRRAWYESNPHAADVPRGQPGSRKKEQGGFIYWNRETGRLEVERLPPGDRDGLPGLPPSIGPGRELVGSFHTHPNTAAEGYAADPSPVDRHFTQQVTCVPEIIETHQGRKTIPPL